MSQNPISGAQQIKLSNVSWQQFEQLLAELGEERSTRLTYRQGKIEMSNPTEDLHRCHRLIESLILLLADELYLDITALGSVTLKHAGLGCAIEPDGCYYLRQVALSGRAVDLTQIPAPNLVVEIAIVKSAIDRLALYQRLGIAEVWRYVPQANDKALNGELRMYQLENDRYVDRGSSLAFPFLPVDRVLEFLGHSNMLGLAQALQLLRSWLNQQGLCAEP
jgi:Uma2 family endonuclease